MRRHLFNETVVIWIAGVIGAILAIPMGMEIAPDALHEASLDTGLPVAAILALQIAQSAVLLLAASLVGMWAARKLGLGAPLIRSWLSRGTLPAGAWRQLAGSALVGVGAAALVLVLEFTVFAEQGREMLANAPHMTLWIRLLAVPYGGLTEEIILRLFAMSLIGLAMWGLVRLTGRAAGDHPPQYVLVLAAIIAAILFGLGHLPATARMVDLSALIVIRTLVLNGIIGLLAGLAFARRGIEHAFVLHLAATLVLQLFAAFAMAGS